ncbi:hypothetical protein IQ230_10900 [Gloeocapsopsis crepidinum LEGE 06123]|uniref:Uncharacterized protein n=1 Tax=Gloeocapsopsis crepidinum LEGE 06123 TaxID=588587 RepID=A0ABR9UU28_9CHRO|nr:hypothetical protein [Gloeocapsopsis crepidinum]MBE9190853.1 hypothetical protein [Gloeocapsopsis crepidinum LEGE 06123]
MNNIFSSKITYRTRQIFLLSLAVTNISIIGIVPSRIAQAAQEVPVVSSSALGRNMDVPWSRPVQINDPFEGSYLGVFDRNYFYRRFLNNNVRFEVLSLWSPNSVRFLLASRERNCAYSTRFSYNRLLAPRVLAYRRHKYLYTGFPYASFPVSRCAIASNTQNTVRLLVRIGEQVYQLDGNNSTFAVNPTVANALKTAPIENVSIRLVTESGETIDSEIGKGTVEAWREIY